MRCVFLCLALSAGCAEAVSGPHTGLATTVHLSQTSFHLGDSIAVTVTLVNAADTVQSVIADPCFGTFVVLSTNGQQIGPGTVRDCFTTSPHAVLSPGDSVSFSEHWNGSMIPRSSAAEFVPPGRYFVRGVLSGLVVDRAQTVSVDVLP